MRISDWSSYVCSSDLHGQIQRLHRRNCFRYDPAIDWQCCIGCAQHAARANPIGLAEARGVPELGCQIAISFDPLLIHFDVATLAFHGSHEKAERIGSIAIYQTQRIDRITLGLGTYRSVGSKKSEEQT